MRFMKDDALVTTNLWRLQLLTQNGTSSIRQRENWDSTFFNSSITASYNISTRHYIKKKKYRKKIKILYLINLIPVKDQNSNFSIQNNLYLAHIRLSHLLALFYLFHWWVVFACHILLLFLMPFLSLLLIDQWYIDLIFIYICCQY